MTRAIVLAAVVIVGSQQTAPRDASRPPTGSGAIAGMVLAGSTGSEPARRARVTLADVEGRLDGVAVTTDDEGRFEFVGLPKARYTIGVYKAGYLRTEYGAARHGRAGTPVSVDGTTRTAGLSIRILRGSAISGTIRDQRGRPVPDTIVRAWRLGFTYQGDRALFQAGGSNTDDRGSFRVWGLPPGTYFISTDPRVSTFAQGASDFQVLSAADVDRVLANAGAVSAELAAGRANYAEVFFPGTTNLSRAQTILIAMGEERDGVDITISRVTTARIGGDVRTPDGSPAINATVALEPVEVFGAGRLRSRVASVNPSGQFEFLDVAPGQYTVTAKTRKPASAQEKETVAPMLHYGVVPIVVDGTSHRLQLQLRPAMIVSGRLAFEGASKPPDGVSSVQIYLAPPGAVPLNSGPEGGRVAANGTFRFDGVTPGQYRVAHVYNQAALDGWYLHSATANGRDVFDAPLVVTDGEDVELVMTFTSKATEVSGTFQDAAGRPASEHFVVLFPADAAAWRPGSWRIQSTRPATDGRYAFFALPAGDYFLAAVADLQREDLFDREFLEALVPAAVRVTLSAGQTTRQDLRVAR